MPKKSTNKKKHFQYSKLVLKYIRPYWKIFAWGLFFLVLSSLSLMAFPFLMGQLIDSANQKISTNWQEIIALLLFIFLLSGIFSFFRIYLFGIVTHKSLAALKQDVFSHLLFLPMSFHHKNRVGELSSRLNNDANQLQELFSVTLAEIIRVSISFLFSIAALFFISPRLTGFMLAILPLIVAIAVVFGKKIKKIAQLTQDKIAQANIVVEESLQGIANVKSFANEKLENNRFQNSLTQAVQMAIKNAAWRGSFASFILFFMMGTIVLIIAYGIYLVQLGTLSLGDLFSFILYAVFLGTSLAGVAELFSTVQKALGASENLFKLLQENTEYSSFEDHKKIEGNIVFKNVCFAYDNRDRTVLNDISFSIQAGQKLAIIGSSGAGKSTIASLLLRFYAPTSGQILIDNIPQNEFSLNNYRQQLALVPQEVLLFGASIRENILYGKPNATNEELIDAAQKANAWEFIQQFPDGLETLVGERGVQLSGGQRQRIAIARAILRDPAILILDEATSSLDSLSEQQVQIALNQLMENRTTIIIAHRLSTIKSADHVIVVEKGEILESDTLQNLEKIKTSAYQKFLSLQNNQ